MCRVGGAYGTRGDVSPVYERRKMLISTCLKFRSPRKLVGNQHCARLPKIQILGYISHFNLIHRIILFEKYANIPSLPEYIEKNAKDSVLLGNILDDLQYCKTATIQ